MLDLPPQPGPRQAPRRAAGAARHPARPAERGRDRPALPPDRARRGAGADPARRDRGRHAAHGRASESIVFQTTEDFTIEPLRARRLRRSSRDGAGQGRRRRRRRSRSRTAPTSSRSARRRRSATRCTSASTRSIARLCCASTSRPRRRAAPASTRATRRCAGRSPAGDNEWLAGRGARGPHRRLQLRQRLGRAAAAGAQRRSQLLGGQRLHWVRCRLDAPTTVGQDRRDATRKRPRSTRSPPRRSARCCPPRTRRASPKRAARRQRRHARARSSRCARARCSRCRTTRRSRCAARRRATWRRGRRASRSRRAAPSDRHFSIDLVAGQIELGPAIRETDGSWTQYGAVPPKGALLRFTGYRHGGGRRGNVAAGTLTMLKSSLAGIATVVNPRAAVGGVDAESLTAARQRAAMEIRTRYRAVTAEDYEFLAGEASPRVARALLPAAARRRRRSRCTCCRASIPADRQLDARGARRPTRRCFAPSPSTSTSAA